jgi:hypothetical protein
MMESEEPQEVSAEVINEACAKYPGYPYPLAVAKLLIDKMLLSNGISLAKGTAWGGVHPEEIPELMGKIAEQLYIEGKQAVTIKMGPENPESDYDHYWVEILGIE